MNYGSFLQGFALKKTIEALGHQCEFIDIKQGKIFPELRRTSIFLIQKAIERYCKWDVLTRIHYTRLFQRQFNNVFFYELGVNKHTIKHFDTVVIGSDEVFNCAQRTWFGFSPQLFGKGLNADKKITYAASFGATTLDKLQKMSIKEEISELLKQLDCISVRDGNSAEVVKVLTGKDPLRHVDPVLIYDYTQFMPLEIRKDKYMIVYTYPERITNVKEITAIKQFARDKGLKLISIGHYFPWCDEVVVPTPFEVLAYFRDADYIVTDTFHGSIFSIKHNKPFGTIIRTMNNQKLSSLLKQFGLESRIVNDVTCLQSILETPIDYTLVNKQIAEERNQSIKYLSSQLS